MNERIAKRLGWHKKTRAGEWYTAPHGLRVAEPPKFDEEWELWHDPGGGVLAWRLHGRVGMAQALHNAISAPTIQRAAKSQLNGWLVSGYAAFIEGKNI